MRQTARVVARGGFDALAAASSARAAPAAAGGGAGRRRSAAVDGKTALHRGQRRRRPPAAACHTLADAGTSGATGPDLDETLRGQDAAHIREAIADPNAEIAQGFGRASCRRNYEQISVPRELDALVEYLDEVSK